METVNGFFKDSAVLFEDVIGEENAVKVVTFVLDIRGVLVGVILSVGDELPALISFFRGLVLEGNSERTVNKTPEFRDGETALKKTLFRFFVLVGEHFFR